MPRPNTTFDISVDDMDLIESALRAAIPHDADADMPKLSTAARARQINDLLGRLHNQKNFYRPKAAQYISG